MNKKRTGAVLVALLMCSLALQSSAQDAEPKFNSNAYDITKIRGPGNLVLSDVALSALQKTQKRRKNSAFQNQKNNAVVSDLHPSNSF